jgi:hypothetical protein
MTTDSRGGETQMIDTVEFRSPLGPVGSLVDRAFLAGDLRCLLAERGRAIKSVAESASARTVSP